MCKIHLHAQTKLKSISKRVQLSSQALVSGSAQNPERPVSLPSRQSAALAPTVRPTLAGRTLVEPSDESSMAPLRSRSIGGADDAAAADVVRQQLGGVLPSSAETSRKGVMSVVDNVKDKERVMIPGKSLRFSLNGLGGGGGGSKPVTPRAPLMHEEESAISNAGKTVNMMIGVPLMNRQMRESLKDRVVV
jgi:hypothetical protein